MATFDQIPVNPQAYKDWNDPDTVYIARIGVETPDEAAARVTSDNNIEKKDAVSGTIVFNPNEEVTGPDAGSSLAVAAGGIPTFLGTINEAFSLRQNDEKMHLVVISFEDGLVQLNDTVPVSALNVPSGKSVVYLVDNMGSNFIGGFVNRFYEPFLGLQVTKYIVDLSQGRDAWQATGAIAYTKLIFN